MVLEALSREFRSGVTLRRPLCRRPCYYRRIARGMCQKALVFEKPMEEKELRVNAGKTKIIICGTGLELLQSSGEFRVPSAALEWAATASSESGLQVLAAQEMQWTLALSTDLHGARELLASWTANHKGNSVGPNKLEVVASFCYLGDMLSAAGDCELSTTTRVKTAWKKFKELLPVPSPRSLSFRTCGSLYSSYVRNAMLHAS